MPSIPPLTAPLQGILDSAALLVDLIKEFFRHSIDSLNRERALFDGPPPLLLASMNVEDLCILLSGSDHKTSQVASWVEGCVDVMCGRPCGCYVWNAVWMLCVERCVEVMCGRLCGGYVWKAVWRGVTGSIFPLHNLGSGARSYLPCFDVALPCTASSALPGCAAPPP